MTTASLRTVISPRTSLDFASCWVRLEQIIPAESQQFANAADVYNLWLAAATGHSAVRLRPDGCPVEFDGDTVRAFLGFYIWPSRPDLEYTLSAALGEIGPRSRVNARREFSAFIDNSSRYALPYYMTGVSAQWETPTFSPTGERITPPAITVVDGIWLVFSATVFGAVRIAGTAVGASVVLEMDFEKGVTSSAMTEEDLKEWHSGPNGEIILSPAPDNKLDSHKIADLENAITVAYLCNGESGGDAVKDRDIVATTVTTEQTEVVIPKCLQDVLNFCPGMFDGSTTTLWCEKIPTKQVYYNACNGEILGSREKDGQTSYCSRVANQVSSSYDPSSWLPEGWR